MRINRNKLGSIDEFIVEAYRYYNNGLDRLKDAKIEYKRYMDKKPVREASAIIYLASLVAIDGYLVSRGVERRALPRSIEGYWEALNKHMVHDGKIKSALDTAYENLHILGYYRGAISVKVIKEGTDSAKLIIDKISKIVKKNDK
ncbi:MAG: DUF5618 family protein [Candidatus Stahlbacteria bacterium]|nr:DUF5618 family protein [Candidatus Stahlbacteria bacterium]